ncbi:hypothetical protein [Pyxidicoccus xibeiensis]|uniref:hypothetical protein n=1 Tax=Pyxidicoccus xibeiensis TaxID=2906759 RepID=UPI0020A78DF0|nr:hypothetical protein [Pyxidicoccus xibeiensis]MCP3145186.1 hypothetical protein [Pyxidicoccus xibeiensis]
MHAETQTSGHPLIPLVDTARGLRALARADPITPARAAWLLIQAGRELRPLARLVASLAEAGFPLPDMTRGLFDAAIPGRDAGQVLVETGAVKDAEPLARALKAAGYVLRETARGVRAGLPALGAQRLVTLLKEVFHPLSLDPQSLAELLRDTGYSVPEAAPVLRVEFPRLAVEPFATALQRGYRLTVVQAAELAVGLAAADFPFTEAGNALKHCFPDITAAQLVAALQRAYPTPTPLALARELRKAGFTLQQAVPRIRVAFQDVSASDLASAVVGVYGLTVAQATDLAVALAAAEYPPEATGRALKYVFPDITAAQFVAAMKKAYGS